MDEESKNLSIRSEAGGFFSALPEEVRNMLGLLLVFFFFMAGMIALFKLPLIFDSKCWELQLQEKRVFKFNTCTGQIIELNPDDFENEGTE